MVYITGDTHGSFGKLHMDRFPEQAALTKDDYVIVCGDFGIWDDSKEENRLLDELDSRSFTTLFVTGNHSNYDLLAKLPISEWHGGKVQFIRDSVIHLMRGQMFNIGGRSFFTMGGASSHDIQDGVLDPTAHDFQEQCRRLDEQNALYRVNHISWWEQELPSEEEYQTAMQTLEAHNWKTDYIITHCLPTSASDELGGGLYAPDKLTDFLEEITQRCEFRYLFCGHYHVNRIVMDKYVVLYEQILKLKF